VFLLNDLKSIGRGYRTDQYEIGRLLDMLVWVSRRVDAVVVNPVLSGTAFEVFAKSGKT
jgi:hypothetical protein